MDETLVLTNTSLASAGSGSVVRRQACAIVIQPKNCCAHDKSCKC
jgi:hypothetical protein